MTEIFFKFCAHFPGNGNPLDTNPTRTARSRISEPVLGQVPGHLGLKPSWPGTPQNKAHSSSSFFQGRGSIDQLANLHFHFTSVPRCTPMTD